MTAMLAFGLVALIGQGWPDRLSPQVRALAAGRDDHAPLDAPCWNVPIENVARGGLCPTGARGPSPTFLVWGDSHARVLTDPIDRAARHAGRSGVLAARSGCAPLPGVRRPEHGPRRRCDAFADAVLAYALAEPAITDVILIGRWGQLAEGRPYGHEPGDPVRLVDAHDGPTGAAGNRRVLERSLATTAAALHGAGKRVWILGPVPEVGWDVPGTLARAMRFDRQVDIAPTRAEFEARQRHAFAILQRVAAGHDATLVPLHPWLCDTERCRVVGRDGAPLYFDDDHLSRAGARVVAPAVEPIFSTIPQYAATEVR